MFLGVTWTNAGSRRKSAASFFTSFEKVAEKNSVWRSRGQEANDAPDIGDEAHVEHAIGLVEDEHFDARQVDRALLRRGRAGGPASRRRSPAPAAACAPADQGHAAVDRRSSVPAAGRRTCERFPRPAPRSSRVGVTHEDADRPTAAGLRVSRVRCQPLEDGQHEGRRLAGARLGAGEQVATGEDERNRFALDGRGLGVALVARPRGEARAPARVQSNDTGEMLLTMGPSRLGGARSGRDSGSRSNGVSRGADRWRPTNTKCLHHHPGRTGDLEWDAVSPDVRRCRWRARLLQEEGSGEPLLLLHGGLVTIEPGRTSARRWRSGFTSTCQSDEVTDGRPTSPARPVTT